MSTAVIILAAGKGTRMQSDMPKVLHKIAGAPMVAHVIKVADEIHADKTIIVTGHGSDEVEAASLSFNPEASFALQSEQLGTGHAVEQTKELLDGFKGDVFILYGDTPFITSNTLDKMKAARTKGASVVVLGFEPNDPTGYGRLILDSAYNLDAIIEHKDATETQRETSFCNSGVICADSTLLFELIAKLDSNNANGEYYLTDIIGWARKDGKTCAAVSCSPEEAMGINSRVELAKGEAYFQSKARETAMINGATLLDPETVYFSHDTVLGRDVIIEQNTVFGPGVTVETGAHIRAFCHIEGAHLATNSIVGPYARLREGTELDNGAKIGNFVETKNVLIGEGAKVNHLSYVGDAEIGAAANIGAGTITCNYDGVFKHRTIIGERAFIGSNSSLVAPVSIGADAMTGSGSVITEDVPSEYLALGRSKQTNKKGLALRLMNKLRAAKAAQNKGK